MMRADALTAALAKLTVNAPRASTSGSLPAITWIASDEPLLALEAADQVRAASRQLGFTDRRVFHVERGFKLDALRHEANSLSLFANQQLLELRLSGKPTKELGEGLAALAPMLSDDTRLLVSSPRLERATTESAWFGQLERTGWVVSIAQVDRTRLPAWIGERLSRAGQQADAQTLQLIAERVEGNLLAAEQEVRKLGLLFGPGPLPPAEVRAAVFDVARWDAFDLVDAALAGDATRALRCLQGLRAEGVAVPMVLWALADAVRNLVRLSIAVEADRPLAGAMRELRIWGDRERLYPQALRRLARPMLRRLMRGCASVDRITKGLASGDDWQALEAVAMGLAGAPALALQADTAIAA
jgi:DNA polymerase-3 subunit delta